LPFSFRLRRYIARKRPDYPTYEPSFRIAPEGLDFVLVACDLTLRELYSYEKSKVGLGGQTNEVRLKVVFDSTTIYLLHKEGGSWTIGTMRIFSFNSNDDSHTVAARCTPIHPSS